MKHIVEAMTSHPVDDGEGGGAQVPAARPVDGDHDRDEMSTMLAEVDLLGMICDDTGETGTRRGDRIDFGKCPICGHRDCFRYYPKTNSWTCFGASNTTGHEGGSALEYFKATRTDDDVEAVKWLREATGHPYRAEAGDEPHAPSEGAQDDPAGEVTTDRKLPPWLHVQAVDPPHRNPPLVHGLLRRGHVGLLAGKGKSGKSWAAIQLSIAVATGGEWFVWKCEQGRVLYIDPELDPKSLDNRFAEVCETIGADRAMVDEHVMRWSLRGVHNATVKNIVHDLGVSGERFDLVVIDSASCFVEGDENTSRDVRRFAAYVLLVAAITGAAVLLVHHYGKGNAGDRDAADRARGSSVWLDFPDAPLYLTEILPPNGEPADFLDKGERAFLLESGGLREFGQPDPVRVIFRHPAHRIDEAGVTSDWKPATSSGNGGRAKAEADKARKETARARIIAELLSYCYREGVGLDGVLVPDAAKALDVESRVLHDALKDSDFFDVDKRSARKFYAIPRCLSDQKGEQLLLPQEPD